MPSGQQLGGCGGEGIELAGGFFYGWLDRAEVGFDLRLGAGGADDELRPKTIWSQKLKRRGHKRKVKGNHPIKKKKK